MLTAFSNYFQVMVRVSNTWIKMWIILYLLEVIEGYFSQQHTLIIL